MIWALSQSATETFVQLDKTYFESDFVTQDHRWNKDLKQTKIQIINEFADEPRKFPQIGIRVNLTENKPISFSDNLSEQTDNEGNRIHLYGGLFPTSVTHIVRARSTLERNAIGDLLVLGLALPIRKAYTKVGFEPQPPYVRVSNVGQEAVQSGDVLEKIYTMVLSTNINCPYFEAVDLKQLGDLEAILFESITTGTAIYGEALKVLS